MSNKTKKPVLTETVKATGAIIKHRFVAYTGKQAAATEAALGVAVYDAAAGDAVAVETLGTLLVESGGALAVGDAVAADAQGCAVKQAGTAVVIGRAMDTATAANEIILIKMGG